MPMPKKPLTQKDVETIEACAGYGMNMEQIAHVLKMSKKTLERRMKDTPVEMGAKDAMLRGKSVAIAAVSQSAYEMAKSKKEPGMTQFWLQCRAGWKKAEQVEDNKEGKHGVQSADVKVIVTLPDNGRKDVE